MTVLVIGGGGREHAIAWRLSQEKGVRVYATPGNPGIACLGTCIIADENTPAAYAKVAESVKADLTVVGPEAPLVAGVVDHFRDRGLRIVGPTQAAARLEASKVFAKQVMVEAGIPTAAYRAVDSPEQARAALKSFRYPLVLKADGLAAGKGVIIAQHEAEAQLAVNTITTTLGPKLVIEEFLEGEEASFIVLTDGTTALPLEAAQDHKTIHDDDQGPNTGGMGAYCDGRVLSASETRQVMETIIKPAIDYMRRQGASFAGFLYAGLMMTVQGPKLLEFNVRLGDPEAQCLLHRIRGGFLDALMKTSGGDLSGARLDWKPDPSVCVVMAAGGYPGQPRLGDEISGIELAEETGAAVFHAGTRLGMLRLETSGGRILGVTASGPDLPSAIENTYRAVGKIHFEGLQYRSDIGRKGLKRW